MILAGIDEAGYGPLLGPLVVGSTAFRVPPTTSTSGETGDVINLWNRLRRNVSPTRDRAGRLLHIADSKQVYSGSGGLTALEKGVLGFAGTLGLPVHSLDAFLAQVDPAAAAPLQRHPWYAPLPDETFPIAISSALLGTLVNSLGQGLTENKIEILRMSARVLPEGLYNEWVGKTRNKSAALFSQVAFLLNSLMETYATEPGGLWVVCDRQGGREHYVSPLQSMFPDWHITLELEETSHARYTLTRGPARATIEFREKGESVCLATALASMLCKYLRESLMARFNRYWSSLVPGLEPTAGYYTDGLRFLGQIQAARSQLHIPDAMLIRER